MPTSQATQTGTYDISTLLAARNQSAAAFGLETIQRILAADLAAHNFIVGQMLTGLVEMTTDRQRLYGASVGGSMVEVDEYGRSPTQVAAPGSTVGFPLRNFQYAIGWTKKYMDNATPSDLAIAQQAAQKSHLLVIEREIKRAIYVSTDYTFTDFLVDKIALPIKRFANADGQAIPMGPNGETYDATTHTHYTAVAALPAAALTAVINNTIEHGFGGQVVVAINKADEAAVRALTGFVAYPDPRIIFRNTDTPGQTLDISRLDNRAIGIFAGAEVQVKPWALANYAFAWDSASPQKPLAFRQRASTTVTDLQIAAELDTYPLYAKYFEAEFGVGVWTRTNGAVLEFDSAAYNQPVI